MTAADTLSSYSEKAKKSFRAFSYFPTSLQNFNFDYGNSYSFPDLSNSRSKNLTTEALPSSQEGKGMQYSPVPPLLTRATTLEKLLLRRTVQVTAPPTRARRSPRARNASALARQIYFDPFTRYHFIYRLRVAPLYGVELRDLSWIISLFRSQQRVFSLCGYGLPIPPGGSPSLLVSELKSHMELYLREVALGESPGQEEPLQLVTSKWWESPVLTLLGEGQFQSRYL